jgi:acyl-homoserine-lactone acylase
MGLSVLLAATLSATSAMAASGEEARWAAQAQNVHIVRDDWGIAHVHGKSDADAVFGMIYAQAEDDFNRVETNYLNSLGRLAESEGESAIYSDLRMKLFIQPDDLKARYAKSPEWLRKLMVAWADGLNFYLHGHPEVQPRVITRFEPWMALSFSEGSIGGDIEDVPLGPLQEFYGGAKPLAQAVASVERDLDMEPRGSNGIAIAPSNTANHHALLLINPHTSFFFRSELQVASDEGLDAYGAATWGQFFIYQGFNERVGWMHTSSGVDNVDFFAETIVKKNGQLFYQFGKEQRALASAKIDVPYRDAAGKLATKSFTVYRTHHGPIVQAKDGKWLSIALMHKPVEALSQSFLRTKARDYAAYMKVMELRANSSNNTIYADADGKIAYLHPQFIPKRDNQFDYTRPVDGANPATDWKDLHALDEAPHLLNPSNGWIMNTNNWPYSAAGSESPKLADYPRYMDKFGENPRGVHATLLLKDKKDFTPESLNQAAYDSYLPAFARLIPDLVAAYDSLPKEAPLKAKLADPIVALRGWNDRWSLHSVPTALAALWGDTLWEQMKAQADDGHISVYDSMIERATAEQKLDALSNVYDRLTLDFGTWRTPWGTVNRYQRLNGDIVQKFNDAEPSLPVGFTSARWGSLASFGARRYPTTNKYYGTSGNSFVAIVEFGDKVIARAISNGGESSHPQSPHFADQAARATDGSLRPIYFYPADLIGHTEREYQPR